MNLYYVRQTTPVGYDEYDSSVVCAPDVETAIKLHPGNHYWDWSVKKYVSYEDSSHFEVKLIGTAAKGMEEGVVCSSFNAG